MTFAMLLKFLIVHVRITMCTFNNIRWYNIDWDVDSWFVFNLRISLSCSYHECSQYSIFYYLQSNISNDMHRSSSILNYYLMCWVIDFLASAFSIDLGSYTKMFLLLKIHFLNFQIHLALLLWFDINQKKFIICTFRKLSFSNLLTDLFWKILFCELTSNTIFLPFWN